MQLTLSSGNITLTTLDPFLSNLNSGAESTMKFALAEVKGSVQICYFYQFSNLKLRKKATGT